MERDDSNQMTVNVSQAQTVVTAQTYVDIRRSNRRAFDQPTPVDCNGSLPQTDSDDSQDTADSKTQHNKYAQTDVKLVVWAGNADTVICANQYINVGYQLNTETVDKLLKRNCDVESVNESLGQCLAQLDWSVEGILAQKLTSFRMKVLDEKLPRLLSSVVSIVSNNTNLSKILRLMKTAFHECAAQIRTIKVSSLTFCFQYTDEAAAEHMLSSEEAQGKLIGILYQFLPEWVRLYAQWEVTACSEADLHLPSVCDMTPSIMIQMPLPSHYCEDGPTTDPINMTSLTKVIESTIDRSMQDLADQFDSRVNQAFTGILQSVQEQQVQQAQGGQADVQPATESKKDTSHRDSSEENQSSKREGDEKNNAESVHGEDTVDGFINKPFLKQCEEYLPQEGFLQGRKTEGHVSPTALAKVMNNPSIGYPMEGVLAYASAELQITLPHDPVIGTPKDNATEKMLVGSIPGKSSGHEDDNTFPTLEENLKRMRVQTFSSGLGLQDNVKEMNKNRHTQSDGEKSYEEKQKSYPGRDESKVEGNGKFDSAGKASTDTPKRKPRMSKTYQAEQLLSWVRVRSKASQSDDPEIQRLMQQMEHALQDEEVDSPRASALDTVLVLDTSDSVADNYLDELKDTVHEFVDGIEEKVNTYALEENLAVVQMGGRAWVRQHLTNDYDRIRETIDAMTPDSETMPTGGRTPLFQTLLVCLGAVEGKGGVMNIVGCHRVRPRLIIFTDGLQTDEKQEIGPDIQSNTQKLTVALVQLINQFEKHKTTPLPMFWVPIGNNADRAFLTSMATLSKGKVVEKENIEELCLFYKVQQTIGCVYKVIHSQKSTYDTEDKILPVINALAQDLVESDKKYVLEEVLKKQKEPKEESGEADDFDNVYEDKELVDEGKIPALGTRVKRGEDWKWDNQDTEGFGTVLQHRKKRDGWVYVMWDNGTYNAYRYGCDECYDVRPTDQGPRVLGKDELIEIGVEVTRGPDWSQGYEDGNDVGVVVRTRKDGKVRVRWRNGQIGKYRYGADGKIELSIVETPEADVRSVAEAEAELGAVGGVEVSGRRIWQWYEPQTSRWRMYDAHAQDKLLAAYKQRSTGTCIISRGGTNQRVLFKSNQEKPMGRGEMFQVRTQVVAEEDYPKMLEAEDDI